ncbi:hypothetical protein TNCV_1832291 [Trichonephila clavipes]|nr:hypothetical protein TNCV_1832291 [Trichonephila clavipes]
MNPDSVSMTTAHCSGQRSDPAFIVERHTAITRCDSVGSWDTRSSLVVLQGTLTARRYVDDILTPIVLIINRPGAIYQQDNVHILRDSPNNVFKDMTSYMACQDEVEKLAYQLNEEAERTERPIDMYGSTCADMQVDVMGECLSSIKHIVGTTSGCFYPRSNHWEKLEEGRSVTSVAAEFGIAHSIVSRLWRQFQTTGTAIRGFSSGRPRGTTPADDRYTLSYRPEETGGRNR